MRQFIWFMVVAVLGYFAFFLLAATPVKVETKITFDDNTTKTVPDYEAPPPVSAPPPATQPAPPPVTQPTPPAPVPVPPPASSMILVPQINADMSKVTPRYLDGSNGNDNNDGTTQLKAWKTFQKAVEAVRPGNYVIVENGDNYAGFNAYNVTGGKETSPIFFVARNNRKVTINKLTAARNNPNSDLAICNIENPALKDIYFVFIGIQIRGGAGEQRAALRISGAIGVQFLDGDIRYGPTNYFVSNSKNVLLRDCIVAEPMVEHDVYLSAGVDTAEVSRNDMWHGSWDVRDIVHTNGRTDTGLIKNILICDNNLHDAWDSIIDIEGTDTYYVINNRIKNKGKHGVTGHSEDQEKTPPCKNGHILNNVIDITGTNKMAGIQFIITDVRGGLEVSGNTITATNNNACIQLAHGVNGDVATVTNFAGLKSNNNRLLGPFSIDYGNTYINLAAWRTKTGQDLQSLSN